MNASSGRYRIFNDLEVRNTFVVLPKRCLENAIDKEYAITTSCANTSDRSTNSSQWECIFKSIKLIREVIKQFVCSIINSQVSSTTKGCSGVWKVAGIGKSEVTTKRSIRKVNFTVKNLESTSVNSSSDSSSVVRCSSSYSTSLNFSDTPCTNTSNRSSRCSSKTYGLNDGVFIFKFQKISRSNCAKSAQCKRCDNTVNGDIKIICDLSVCDWFLYNSTESNDSLLISLLHCKSVLVTRSSSRLEGDSDTCSSISERC